MLAHDLLPACYDDWILVECERFHQLRLHALEALCERLTAAERYGEAIDAGLAAVCGEPLRESAHRALIKAHLAEGNYAEAGRQYELCRRILRDELGIVPSEGLRKLMQRVPCLGRRASDTSVTGASLLCARGGNIVRRLNDSGSYPAVGSLLGEAAWTEASEPRELADVLRSSLRDVYADASDAEMGDALENVLDSMSAAEAFNFGSALSQIGKSASKLASDPVFAQIVRTAAPIAAAPWAP